MWLLRSTYGHVYPLHFKVQGWELQASDADQHAFENTVPLSQPYVLSGKVPVSLGKTRRGAITMPSVSSTAGLILSFRPYWGG